MAEVYWDMEYDLHQRGFDYTYNKRLYDRLEANNAPGVAAHLAADMSFQLKSVRIAMVVCASNACVDAVDAVVAVGLQVQFVENHDEPRAATVFKNVQVGVGGRSLWRWCAMFGPDPVLACAPSCSAASPP